MRYYDGHAPCGFTPALAVRAVPSVSAGDDNLVYRTSTFLNCHGSDVSISSGNSPGRPDSGVQSV